MAKRKPRSVYTGHYLDIQSWAADLKKMLGYSVKVTREDNQATLEVFGERKR